MIVAGRRRQVAAEVIHHLRHHARPVDRIDSANFLRELERQIVRHCLDQVLAIVEHPFDGDVVDVRILQAEHLGALKGAHFLVRREHEHADTLLAAHGVFGRAASVARGGAKNIELGAVLGQRVLEQVAKQLHGHVLEGQGRSVRQRLQYQRFVAIFFQYPQRRDLARRFALARVAVHLGRVGFAGEGLEVGLGNIGREFFQQFEGQVGVGQLAPCIELGAGHFRISLGQIQAAVGGQAT